MIEIHVRLGPGLSRADFIATHPPYSIALDGYVGTEPFLYMTAAGPYRNFNHHEAVDRSCTTATCEQARRAVLLGLYDLFREKGRRRAQLYVNDCDQDVCLSTWVLTNPDRAAEPLVRQLCSIEDLLDMSSGTFPMPHERDLFGEVRWVFEPYTRVRPRLMAMMGEEMRQVIHDVHLRIDQFVIGRAGSLPLAGEYRRLGGGTWWMVEVLRAQARESLVAAGVRAAVEVTGHFNDRWTYTVWRRSEYIVWFPVRAILDALSTAEASAGGSGHWGGADNVGGSPRPHGSVLSPERVEHIVTEVVAAAHLSPTET
jgi:hypothetical protein